MHHKIIVSFAILATALFLSSGPATASSKLVDYTDKANGFSMQYPDYWTVDKNSASISSTLNGSYNLLGAEGLATTPQDRFKVLIHVDGSPQYLSNVVVLVSPLGSKYSSARDAVEAVNSDFDQHKTTGTYFLEDTYLGESHTYIYHKTVNVQGDSVGISYYLTASQSNAYMMIETVLTSALDNTVYRDQFNQVVQSFRVLDNETLPIDPSLAWGSAKPGTTPAPSGPGNTDVGQVEVRENFDNNAFNWPTGPNAAIKSGRYVLDSRDAFPFTVRNTGLGQISFDFSYEGNVEFLDGNNSAGYGLVFAYTDADDYFAFLVTKGGQFMVVRELGGKVVNIIPWTATPALAGSNHTLSIQGDYQTLNDSVLTHRYTIVFSIDNTEVARTDVNDVLSISGWFGLFVSEGVEVSFDSLIARNYLLGGVMTLDRPAPQ